jgi:hypothetical protein
MPKEEVTGTRKGPSNYSKWHRRALPSWCYVVNGDWFELRKRRSDGNLEIVAYIETIEVDDPTKHTPLWLATKGLVLEAVKKFSIPTFVVWHTPKCDIFVVWKVSENDKEMKFKKVMSDSEYRKFVMNL